MHLFRVSISGSPLGGVSGCVLAEGFDAAASRVLDKFPGYVGLPATVEDLGELLEAPSVVQPTPAQIRASIQYDKLISFEDGKGYKALRRHLTIRGLTAAEYRSKWGLPIDYPMTSQQYSEHRSQLARDNGFGQK